MAREHNWSLAEQQAKAKAYRKAIQDQMAGEGRW